MKTYKELIAWQKAMDLVEKIYRLTDQFPKDEKFRLTDQMTRAVVSIPSNIAEGYGRGTTKDYVRFLDQAKGSANELETQLLIAERLGYGIQCEEEMTLIHEIQRMLGTMVLRMRRND